LLVTVTGLVVTDAGLLVTVTGLVVTDAGLLVTVTGLLVTDAGLLVTVTGLLVTDVGLLVTEGALVVTDGLGAAGDTGLALDFEVVLLATAVLLWVSSVAKLGWPIAQS
jgi:hypothetical protein